MVMLWNSFKHSAHVVHNLLEILQRLLMVALAEEVSWCEFFVLLACGVEGCGDAVVDGVSAVPSCFDVVHALGVGEVAFERVFECLDFAVEFVAGWCVGGAVSSDLLVQIA